MTLEQNLLLQEILFNIGQIFYQIPINIALG